ncbi:MAG: hypothetical protein AAFU67_05265 [Bacteroidota bacterium]
MAQFSWKVRANRGHKYEVGLFHGDDTKHVLLYCDNKVMHIDFAVEESKTYKLLLDEELCEVAINRLDDGKYDYDCRLDDEAETPLNVARREAEAEEKLIDRWRIVAGLSVVCMVFIGWLIWG